MADFTFANVVNQVATTVQQTMTAGSPAAGANLTVGATAGAASKGYAIVGSEIVYYDQVVNSTTIRIGASGRGALGTVAAAHAIGDALYFDPIVSAHINEVIAKFNDTTGHKHSGVSNDAPPIPASSTLVGGRLTLASGIPVTVTDQTAITTVYYTPFIGNQIALYDGAQWLARQFSEISVAVPATTVKPFDVFAYWTGSAVALEAVNWTNDTTRATALVLQNGVYVKSGDVTRRYLGTGRTTGVSGQTEDSQSKRFLFNYYNRVPRILTKSDVTGWTYNGVAWRQMRAQASNQVECVIGVADMIVAFRMLADCAAGASGWYAAGCGMNGTTFSSLNYNLNFTTTRSGCFAIGTIVAVLGYNYFALTEITSGATATVSGAYLWGEVVM